MFFSFKKKHSLLESGILKGMTDIHSHILPGVDDGSPSTASSLDLLNWFERLGIVQVWLTPHVMSDLTQNTPERLTTCFEQFKQQYKGNDKTPSGRRIHDGRSLPAKVRNGSLAIG